MRKIIFRLTCQGPRCLLSQRGTNVADAFESLYYIFATQFGDEAPYQIQYRVCKSHVVQACSKLLWIMTNFFLP